MLLAARPGHVRVPPFGLFRLDPASTLVFPAMRPIGLPRKTTFPAAVPNLAALRGLWIYTQAVLLDPTRILRSRFTNPFRDQIWESFRHGTQSAIFAHTPNRGP